MNQTVPVSGPHVHISMDVPTIMAWVIAACLPATLYGFYQFGWPAISLFVVTISAALIGEAFALKLAGKSLRIHLFDGSALVTAWLLAMSLPPWAPWWIGVLGSGIAILIGKQVFGGIGQNVFNPAMVARVALLVSFPVEMTTWIDPRPLLSAQAPGFVDGLGITFIGIPDVDAVSSASTLGYIKTSVDQGLTLSEILPDIFDPLSAFMGTTNGSMGETSAFFLLLGGLILLFRGIISWHIPFSMITAAAGLALLANLIEPSTYPGPSIHLLSGGMMLGVFFIATDPTTSPSTPMGGIVFGAGCGVLEWLIRTWGGYPEGLGFSILIMNSLTPLIDQYVRPRVYGRNRRGNPLEVPGGKKRKNSRK